MLEFSLKDLQLILSVFMLLSERKLISKLYVVRKGLTVVETSCNHVKIIHRNFQLMELKVLTIVFFTLGQVVEVLFKDMEVTLVFSKAIIV